ncbi:hypothetical protein RUM43_009158 [Polyplax serrata]|uniref:receptor protein-tyrosine kinase n=1 Tax=Polyplax serrata TaxID=468196 RepID=A0AAN8NPU3_POLSC
MCEGLYRELKKEDGSAEVVAIKVLKETASKQAEEDFMREVEIMSAFRHENILSLLGIVLKEASSRPWMVFEFMPHGDLAEVLRSNSRQFWKPVPGLKSLTKDCLLKIALQVAGGMKYLAAQRFVHNDLACRNCLVGSELTVKIADFGMSRDIYTCDYYRIGGSKPVPLRWMSPESVMYRRFTLESDVWSYGVVLWEIYSFGKQPYYGLSNEEVVKMILQGIMLIPPDGCPSFICDLMRACWKSEPKDRIKFPDIYDQLKKSWKETEANRSVDQRKPLPNDGQLKSETADVDRGLPCPRPPLFPISPLFQTEYADMLDADNYLAPQTTQVNEYIQPLPD